MAATELKRDSLAVKMLADRLVVINAKCQISVVDKKKSYTNIAIQNIEFTMNGKEYTMNHIWLQECDYPEYMKGLAEAQAWYEIRFSFYPYRDKVDLNEDGIPMHGITVTSMKKINK